MSVPVGFVFPPQASATTGDDVAAIRAALSFLPSGQVDAPESQDLRPDSHKKPHVARAVSRRHPDPPEEPLALAADVRPVGPMAEHEQRSLGDLLVAESL